MLVLELKKYLQISRIVSIKEISNKFNVSTPHLRFILNKWIDKGELEKNSLTQICATNTCGCSSCSVEAFELYRWKA